ncbi:hypothetical protein [Lysinibacillus sp. NPDC096212]|uniref:hypothetical protein n=1 Tax=Lysinibacillus sp. NPDC096212 TaxID=3364135 RepID=UPI0037FFC5BD
MGAIKRTIDKYCRATNSKLLGYDTGYFYFIDSWGEEKRYKRKQLFREVSLFE